MKFLPLMWSGIWRKPGRTLLAMVQIVATFALFGVLQGFSTGVKYAMAHTSADSLWVHSRGSFSDLPLGHYERIKRVPGVRRVSYRNYIGARYQDPKQQLLIIAAEPYDWAATTDDVTVAPKYVEALARTRTGAIVGMTLVRKYGWKLGQHVSLQTDVTQKNGSKDWEFDIVGFMEHTDPALRNHTTIMLVNYSYYDEARSSDNGTVQQYSVQVSSAKRFADLKHSLEGNPSFNVVLGALIAWLLFDRHHVAPAGVAFDLAVTPSVIGLGITWGLCMGLIGGVLPAVRTARLSVAYALRAT
jgi:putative ABC transport system permease protein